MKSPGRGVVMKHDRPTQRYRAATAQDHQRLSRGRGGWLLLFLLAVALGSAMHARGLERDGFDIDLDEGGDDDTDYGYGL